MLHDVGGILSTAQQVRHDFHGAPDVPEEGLISGTEIVQAGFALGRELETISGTLPITGESYVALPAIAGKGVAFGISKGALTGPRLQSYQMLLFDIPSRKCGSTKWSQE